MFLFATAGSLESCNTVPGGVRHRIAPVRHGCFSICGYASSALPALSQYCSYHGGIKKNPPVLQFHPLTRHAEPVPRPPSTKTLPYLTKYCVNSKRKAQATSRPDVTQIPSQWLDSVSAENSDYASTGSLIKPKSPALGSHSV